MSLELDIQQSHAKYIVACNLFLRQCTNCPLVQQLANKTHLLYWRELAGEWIQKCKPNLLLQIVFV